jgi:hypothetical protein
MSFLRRQQTYVIAFAVLLSFQLIAYTSHFAVNMMFWDQWDFYRIFFEGGGVIDAFRFQHGPHRQGLGAIFIGIAASTTQWDGRADAYLVAVALIVACILALVLKHRIAGKLTLLDCWIPILFLSPSHWELLVVAPNVSHSALPLALVMLYALALTFKRAGMQALVISIVSFFLLYTGFGIFAALLTPLLFLFRSIFTERAGFERSTRWMWIAGFVVSALALFSFFRDWTFSTASPCFVFPHPRPLEYFVFAGLQVAHAFGLAPMADHLTLSNTFAIVVGLIVMAGGIVVAALSVLKPQKIVIAFLIAFSLLFIANTAVGRVCLGATQQSLASRYAALVLPMLFGIYLWVCDGGRARQIAFGIVTFALILLSFIPPFYQNPYILVPQFYHDSKTSWRTCYLARLDPIGCDAQVGLPMHPDTKSILGRLRFLEARRLNLFKDAQQAVQITSPADESVSSAETLALTGVIDPPGFEHYEVTWGAGEFPQQWNWVSGPHLSTVRDGEITRMDTSPMPSGVNTIRVTAFMQDGSQQVAKVRVVKP